MSANHVPMHFNSLSFEQLQLIEKRAILECNREMRFTLMRAAKGDIQARRLVMTNIQLDPSWIGIKQG